MRLHRLRLTEFRQFADADIAFEGGLCALVGPNGAGKSTLLEAIVWALLGAGAARRSEESLRRAAAPQSATTEVELHFSAARLAYRLRRSIATAGAGIASGVELADADGAVLATGAAAVSAALAEALHARRDAIMHACFTGRKELHQLAQLKPAERLRFIARLLGDESDRREDATVATIAIPDPALVMPRRAPAESQRSAPADVLMEAVAALEQELAEADERIRTLGTAPDLLEQYTAELDRLRTELEQAEAAAQRLHDDWAQKRQEVDTKLDAYHRRADELRQQIDRVAASGAAGVCPTCERPLGPHVERMAGRLDDEHYINAQDTKWLVQRQLQLAKRPPDLRQAETDVARLRSAVEDRTQRAARCEQAMQELWTVASERKRAAERLDMLRRDAALAGRREPVTLRREILRDIEALAGAHLARITDRRYDGISLTDDGRVYGLAAGVATPVVSGGDEDAIALVLRLATMQRVRARHASLEVMLLDEPFGSMDPARRRRALELLRELGSATLQIVISSRNDDIAALADQVLHIEYDPVREFSIVSRGASG
jgi:DNA repair protein SbcC/Rad50